MSELPTRFCGHCGKSIVPLPVPHIVRKCEKCEKDVHIVETGPDGRGLAAKAGDKIYWPKVSVSLDPRSGGRLFRPGLWFLLRQLFYATSPKVPADVEGLAERLTARANALMAEDEWVRSLDPDDPDIGNTLFETLQKNQESRTWHAYLVGCFASGLREAFENNDPQMAAWAAYNAAMAYGMTIVREESFDRALWRGYIELQTEHVAEKQALPPQEVKAFKALSKLLSSVDPGVLYAYCNSGAPIGPRIGFGGLPEEIIASYARYHLEQSTSSTEIFTQESFRAEQGEVFLSYSRRNLAGLQQIDELSIKLAERGHRLIRDVDELEYKDSIAEFMSRMSEGKAIVVFLSHEYWRSEYCMQELLSLSKNPDFRNRIFPLVFGELKINQVPFQAEIVRFWEQKIAEAEGTLKTVQSAKMDAAHKLLNLYHDIRSSLQELFAAISDMNLIVLEEGSGFSLDPVVGKIDASLSSVR